MKIKILDDLQIVIYLYNYFFQNKEKKELEREIKLILIRLIKNYHIKLNGFYDIEVYTNKKYGTILELELKEEFPFNNNFIDIKVKIYENTNVYLKSKSFFILEKFNNIYYKDSYYYINIIDINNLINIIEFVDIIYKEKDINLNNMIYIK